MTDRLPLTPDEFRALADRVVELAAGLLAELPRARAFPETSGAEVSAAFDAPLPEEGLGPTALDDLSRVVALSRPPGPRFFGYVLGSGEPVAALADLLASVLNQNVTPGGRRRRRSPSSGWWCAGWRRPSAARVSWGASPEAVRRRT